jgi:tRNA-dihydrouridine synthase
MLLDQEFPDATGKMKQFASWFTHGVPGGAGLRKAIYEAKTGPAIIEAVEKFFSTRIHAMPVDAAHAMEASVTLQ